MASGLAKCYIKTVFFTFLAAILFLPCNGSYSASKIKVEPDGGYSGIVIKIKDDVAEEECQELLTNLKVRRLIN